MTRYVLEGSSDGEKFEVLRDKSSAETNLPHDTLLIENGKNIRFIKLTILELPMNQKAAVSGLRVFGKGNGKTPGEVTFSASLKGELDMTVTMASEGADGFNIKWGHAKDKLYHGCMYYPEKGSTKGERTIGALIKGEEVYLQVDSFNENGITHGVVQKLRLDKVNEKIDRVLII